jgi:terminase large subunit-like protein
MNTSCVLGIDLGQSNDPTAIVLLEHPLQRDPVYELRYAYRFPLGTSYLDLADRIALRVNSEPLGGRITVAIDATGVGQPVVDLLRPKLNQARCYAITITGGTSVHGGGSTLSVPKRDLVTTVQLLLQQRRLRIAPGLADATTLIDELLAYRVTISEAGHDSYATHRERDHDDLVLALCLAAWTAENKAAPRPAGTFVPRGRIDLRYTSDHDHLGLFPGGELPHR